MKKIALHWLILLALICAVFVGLYFPGFTLHISWIGTLFIRGLKMIVIPLVITSLLSGMLRISDGKNLGRITFKTFTFYIITSLLAILTGLFAVNIFAPGKNISIEVPVNELSNITPKPLSETLLDIIPTNIFDSLVTGDKAMLSIIFFTILFGFFMSKVSGKPREIFGNVVQAAFDAMMRMTMFVIKFAPIGVFALVSTEIAKQSNIAELAAGLGKYTLTVIGALAFHFFVTLPVIIWVTAKVNPLQHFKNMATPLLTAFSTASSNATLPLTIQAIENKNGVSNKISSFTLPLGATINMDGTALYELVVAGFIAQLYGIDLSFSDQFIMVTTALLASIGTAAVPMASLVTMTIIFTAINLPIEAIAIILPIDRPLDMCRTATNVWSDSCCATIIAKSENEKLKI